LSTVFANETCAIVTKEFVDPDNNIKTCQSLAATLTAGGMARVSAFLAGGGRTTIQNVTNIARAERRKDVRIAAAAQRMVDRRVKPG